MNPENYKFHSTNQFRNVVKSIKESAVFAGFDDEGNVVKDYTKPIPKLDYVGTTKLHGTNGSIIIHENGDISFHSKSNLLGFVRNDEFTLLRDNAEFAQTMFRRIESVKEVVDNTKKTVEDYYGKLIYPIKISGEWCGQGVQKNVGISYLTKRSFFIFGIKVGDVDVDMKTGWLSVDKLYEVTTQETQDDSIYSITDFPVKYVTIDFANPEFIQNTLVEAAEAVEKECPVSKTLGLKNSQGEDMLLGEGLVWVPCSPDYCFDNDNWFKTKGQKHSVSKVKSVAAIDPEKVENIQKFVEYAVTENRLEQGVSEVGLDQKKIGEFIGWINRDINKEEADTLEANNFTMKDVGKVVSAKAREFYIEKLNKNL